MEERRRSKRFSRNLAITLLVVQEGQKTEHPAFVLDQSLEGLRMRIHSDAHLRRGQMVEILTKKGSEKTVPARVIWVHETGSLREGEAGLEFSEPIAALF